MVEAFPQFPRLINKDVGAFSCLTDCLLARNELGVGHNCQDVLNKSQLIKDLVWPDKQEFIIYIMQETVPATVTKKRMEKFMELLEKAFQEMSPKGDAAAFILKFDNAFDNKRREDNIEFLNISFEPID